MQKAGKGYFFIISCAFFIPLSIFPYHILQSMHRTQLNVRGSVYGIIWSKGVEPRTQWVILVYCHCLLLIIMLCLLCEDVGSVRKWQKRVQKRYFQNFAFGTIRIGLFSYWLIIGYFIIFFFLLIFRQKWWRFQQRHFWRYCDPYCRYMSSMVSFYYNPNKREKCVHYIPPLHLTNWIWHHRAH